MALTNEALQLQPGDVEPPVTTPRVIPVAPTRPGRRSGTALALGFVLVLVILLQRFAIPFGTEGVSVTLVVGLVAMVGLLITGALTHDLTRVILFAVAVSACGLAAWWTSVYRGGVSISSFMLLVVVYLPWLFRVREAAGRRSGATWLSDVFVKVMLVAGVVAIVQMALQVLGFWTYYDLIGETVSKDWLLANYNTTIPIEYASPIVKSQAFVFLEPSFLCQFLALAIIIGILRRAALWQLAILAVAMFCTYSGTGIVLLLVGLLVILVRARRTIRPGMVLIAVGVGAALLLSPYAEPLLDRSDEATQSSSSLSLRFVDPYVQVVDGLQQEPIRYLTGAGPGASERVLENARQGMGQAVVYTIVPKLVFEYGLIPGLLFVAFIIVSLFRRPHSVVVPITSAVMLLFLSGSLLQPHTLLVAWLLSAVWSRE